MNLGKTLFQFAVLVALFFGSWLGLRQVNWLNVTNWQKHTDATEEKIGDMVWDAYHTSEHEIYNEQTLNTITRLVNRICKANHIDSTKIKIHLLKKDEVNAFTLPNNHIVVYSGLIAACHNEEELVGVLGHEMAHMEKHHVMKKIVKQVGLTTITTIAAGKGGGQAVRKIMEMMTSNAYDRDLEKEADITSVDYMTNAGISAEPFADFLYRMGEEKPTDPIISDWLNTHPDSKQRGMYIIDYYKKKNRSFPRIDDSLWQGVHREMSGMEEKDTTTENE